LDIKRLTRGEQILGVAAALLLILSFIPMWAKVEVSAGDFGSSSESFTAWDAYDFFPLKLGLLIALIAVIWVGVRAANVNVSWPAGAVSLALGGLTLVLLLITILTGPAGGSGESFGGFGVEVSRGIFLWVGIACAAAMAYGGYLAWQESEAGTTSTYGGPAAPPPGPPPA
jgi:hypothetical protein